MCCLYNTWLAGISTDFYYKLIEIGAKPYLALGLISEGYWQVNSQRSIFCIADLIIGHGVQSANSSKVLTTSSNCSLLTEILWNLAIQLKIINHKIKFHVKFSCHIVLNSRHPSPLKIICQILKHSAIKEGNEVFNFSQTHCVKWWYNNL